jgi:hypothetical protein
MLVAVAVMGAIVVVFRLFLRRPKGLSCDDAQGLRTVALFRGDDPEFLADDRDGEMFVGIRLFDRLCGGLAASGVAIENRGTIEHAQKAECVVDKERFQLVLEAVDNDWVLGVEWAACTSAERRHLALTHQVFAPPDSPALRTLLAAIDAWLKRQPNIFDIAWHRKEDWLTEELGSPADAPIAADPTRGV